MTVGFGQRVKKIRDEYLVRRFTESNRNLCLLEKTCRERETSVKEMALVEVCGVEQGQ